MMAVFEPELRKANGAVSSIPSLVTREQEYKVQHILVKAERPTPTVPQSKDTILG